MADSNITKNALASALKELLENTPFEKITVGHICAQCEMNRKSFYYHFKDKYELVNWIYYTEFISSVKDKKYETGLSFLYDVCAYFEQNRQFYRRIIKYDGQNSFFEYFREINSPIIEKNTKAIFADKENNVFYTNFFTDAILIAIKNWLQSSDNMPADKFISLIRSCIYGAAKRL